MAKLVFTNHPALWRTGSDYPKIPLTQVSWDSDPSTPVAFVYFGHVNIDFDGSSTAYAPPGSGLVGDDDLGNAFEVDKDNNIDRWFGVVALRPDDPAVVSGAAKIDQRPELAHGGKYPVVQQEANGDPNPGYYVSATPHASGEAYCQTSYVDASCVPFGALSGKFKSLGVALGDYGLALRHDQTLQSGFYFVDVGGNNYALGECSHRVGKDLGGSGRGNRFNNNFPVSFIVFPQSGEQDPQAIVTESDDQIAKALRDRLQQLAAADNADDLALLMGFNETAPQTQPAGLAKLSAYAADPANGAKPRNYDNVAAGLASWGYATTT